MSKRFYISVLIAITMLSLSVVAFSQETTGGIEGTVKDSAGSVVPNVTVTITTAAHAGAAGAGFRRTVTTDDEGFFRALQVPPGVYTVVTTASSGFGEARYANVTVSIGKNTQLEISVKPGSAAATVDVSASDLPPVDTTNSAIQTSINAQKMELLPKGTGFTSILKSVPGTRPERQTGGFTVDGASGGENVFVIDGQEVTNYRTGTLNDSFSIPTQLVQEVQVKSSGFEAEFGGATGGVISVVSKGGTNDFHGEFGVQFETPEWNGMPRPLLQRFTTGAVVLASTPPPPAPPIPASPGTFRQYTEVFQPHKAGGANFFPTANLGGPIFKDKVWFFGSYSPQFFDTNIATNYFTNAPAVAVAPGVNRSFIASEKYTSQTRYEYAFARINANPFNSLRINASFLWNPVIQTGSIPTTSFSNVSSSAIGFGNVPTANYGPGVGTLTGAQFRDKQGGRQTSNFVTVDGTYTPTSTLVISGRYGRGFLNEKNGNYFLPLPTATGIACGVAIPGFTCSNQTGGSQTLRDVSIRESYDFFAAYIFDGGGRHEMKGGYQRATISNDVALGNTAVGGITFVGGPIPNVTPTPGAIGYGQFRRQGTNGFGSNLSHSIFIQDKWQPTSRLTLNLGVRFEQETLPTFNGIPSGVDFSWGEKIAPRLGFAFDLTGDGRTKLFASYGQFYDRVKFSLPRGLFGGDIFLDDFFEIFPGQNANQFNIGNILGTFTGPSVCPTTGFIIAGALSRCQLNRRVNANEPGASPFSNGFVNGGAVDPNLDPFRQTEFTVGLERQIGRVYVFRGRYTYKNVDEAVEDAGIVNVAGSEAYIIGNPGKGLHLLTLQTLGYQKSTRPQRRYDAMEIVFERRLADSWYFNANYTLSRLFGNYSGLASSDEAHLLFGRLNPGVSRAFDLPFIGFTAQGEPDNGRLQTDRPHVFNVYGAYIVDWFGSRSNSTEISAFQTIASGTPQTTSIFGSSTITPQIFLKRGDLGRSPTFSQTDLNVTHRYRFGADSRFSVAFDFNVLNLFDQDTITGYYPTINASAAGGANAATLTGNSQTGYANGWTSGTLLPAINAFLNDPNRPDRKDNRYGQPQIFQGPRAIRFGMRFLF
jgi:hypothetical protein